MIVLIRYIRYLSLALAVLLTAAGCSRSRYRAVSDSFDSLLEGATALDTIFVAAMNAGTPEAFDAETVRFMEAYGRDFDDPGLSEFNARTPYAVRQDSLLFYMQDYLLNTFRYEESIELGRYLDDRVKDADRAGSMLHSASVGDIAVAYFYLGNLEEAIEYQRAGYEIDLRLGDRQLLSSDFNQLAAMCLRSERYELARDYILSAIEVEEALERPAVLAIRYGLASEIFLKLRDYATAEDYARRALEIDRHDGRDRKVGIRLSQLAAIQIARCDTAGAEQSLAEAVPMLRANNNLNSLAIANCQVGELALRRGDEGSARQAFLEALQLCRAAGIKPIEKRALYGLWLAMKDSDRARGADYLEHYSALSDSLVTASTDSQVANLRAEFATRELRLDNERLEARNRINRIVLISSAVLFLLLCVVAYLIYRNRTARQRLMRHMEQVRLNFFTNITHEFRTPLTVILGLSAELEKHDDSRPQAEVISEEGRNLLGLVNQLLDIGKINSSAGQAEWRHGNIVGYLNMLVESLRPLAVSREAELVFAPMQNDVQMDFVPDYIRKIVVNILSNAFKYLGSEGQVLISARVAGPNLLLRFADNGSGINRDDLEHIFEPFYQGTNSKTAVGTGVGLSLVKLLVKAMDGDISVRSSAGIGTVFIVTLPLKHAGLEPVEPFEAHEIPAVAPERAPEGDAPAPAALDGERSHPAVLIVEDNVNVANYIASQLSTAYHIYTARNGEEGYNKALAIVPDLIISDIMMPVMDGIELLRKLRQSEALNHLPVVMVTARASDRDRIEGVTAGADAYISKPFNADELRAVAARLIEQRRLLCEKYRALAAAGAGEAEAQPDEAQADESTDSEDRAFIARLVNVVYNIIGSDRRADVSEIAADMNMSERSLARWVQALTGETTATFVNRVKIDMAKRLLNAGRGESLAEIASCCGFDDPAYFSRIFKQLEGVTPTAYRRRAK